MRRYLPAILAVAVFALPLAAMADSVKVGNLTTKKLNFSIRCNDGSDGWHTFKLKSFHSKDYMSGDWNYSCDNEKYQIRVGTTQNDGSVIYKIVNMVPGNSYALVDSSSAHGYTAYNTDYLVAMRNDTQVSVNVNYRCTDGGDGNGVAVASPAAASWFYVSGCDSYNVVTTTREKDGSETSFSKTVAPNNIYRIVWNSDRRVYELLKL
jgi:hypothetical protein